jgi:hypothetical protein
MALALIFFAELVLHPSWVLYTDYSDLLTYQVPQMRFLVSSWQQTGELPLWCPYSFSGMPFIHDLQVGAFYPPHLVLYFLPEEMVGPALSWLIVAHVIVAGWTMYAYARSHDLNRTGATIAALGYMFSGKWMLHLLEAGQYVAVGLAWLPLVLLLLERSIKRGRLLSATWAGAAFALVILESHPQFTFYAGLFIALWTLPVALERAGALGPGDKSRGKIAAGLGRWLGAGVWCGLAALALTAIQILPTLEATRYTTRGAAGMPFDILNGCVFNVLGLVGPAPASMPIVGWENRTGLTVLWMATALLAPVLARGNARLRLQTMICFGTVIFGLGGALVFQPLPGFRLFRFPSRMFLVAALPISLLVGMVTQAMFDLLRANPSARSTLRRCLLLILLIALETTAFLCWKGGPPFGAAFLAYWGSLLVTVPAACLILRSPGPADRSPPRWTARSFALAWGALLVVDLWAMGWPLARARAQGPIYTPPSCVRVLIENHRDHERIFDREVPDRGESNPFGFALPILNRLEPLRGYNPIDIQRYKEFIQFISDRDEPVEPGNGILNFPVVNKPLLDLLAVRYLVQPSDLPRMDGEPSDVAHDPRWRKVAVDPAPEAHLFVSGGSLRLPEFSVYENVESLPRAFVVNRAEPLPDRGRVLSSLKQADLRQVVFLEGMESQPENSTPVGRLQPASIVDYRPNHVAVDVDLGSPGYLVLSDPWYPGWTCTLDDQPTRLYRANYAFRAVAVPAGRHRVRFDFAPMSYHHGKMISTLAMAAILGLGLVSNLLRGRRWPPGPQRPSRVESGQTESERS